MARPTEVQTGAPRWVKVSAVAGGVVALLFAVILASGHGPGRHLQGMGAMPMPAAAGEIPVGQSPSPAAN